MLDPTNRRHFTVNVDEGVRNAFKAEVAHNGSDMSRTIESFMISYTNVSVKKRKQKLNENDG